MALDPNIIGGIRPIQIANRLEQFGQFQQARAAMSQNRLAELALGEKQRETGETQQMNRLYKEAVGADGTLDRNKLLGSVASAGLGARLPGLQKSFADADKATADVGKTNAEARAKQIETAGKQIDIAGRTFNYVRMNPTLENANSALDYLVSNGVFTAEQGAQYKARVAADPTTIAVLADQAFRSALDAKDQLATFQTRNTGGSTDTLSIDPVTGQAKVINSVKNTQSPDSVASVAATMRGQDMVDRRAAANQPGAKPLPTQALKMQQTELEALGTAGGIDGELARIEGWVSSGKLSFGPVLNLINRGRNAAGMSTEESRNFASFQSTLEKLRNDSLRLNAGVQTDGDAQRAWNELFANINDIGVVKQRLAEIRNINKRGAQLRKLNIDGIRANYGHDPLDTSRYEQAGAPAGGVKPTASPRNTGLPSGWSVEVN